MFEKIIKDCILKTGRKPKSIESEVLYGMHYKIDRIMEIANHYEIPVIENDTEVFGIRFNG